jgi:hypothetical protein
VSLPLPETHHHTARIKAAWLWQCLRLLHTGFPDAHDERVWQDTCAVTSVLATDPVGLIYQSGIFVACLVRTWQAGLLQDWSHASNMILFSSHGFGWVFAILRLDIGSGQLQLKQSLLQGIKNRATSYHSIPLCMPSIVQLWSRTLRVCYCSLARRSRYTGSRRTRARLFLAAAVNDFILLALVSMGLLHEAGMLARMSVRTWSASLLVFAQCLQMQVSTENQAFALLSPSSSSSSSAAAAAAAAAT